MTKQKGEIKMKYEEWRKLQTADDYLDVNGRYQQAYIEFMYNSENENNCAECPHNNPNVVYSGKPCGQQNCWVLVHCDRKEER